MKENGELQVPATLPPRKIPSTLARMDIKKIKSVAISGIEPRFICPPPHSLVTILIELCIKVTC